MSRTTYAIDRVASFIVALVLIAAGVFAVLWRFDLWGRLPERTDLSAIFDVMAKGWWSWALSLAGILLVLLGLRWLFAHLPGRGVGELNLPGTGRNGRLRFNAKAAASAAADVLAQAPSVRSAQGTVRRDRGQLVVDLRTTVEPDADLEVVAAAADKVVADLASVMDRHDIYGRVRVDVASGTQSRIARVNS